MISRVDNPPNPYHGSFIEWLDCEENSERQKVVLYAEKCKSAISTNNSPDIGFNYSINPYRGCFHACAYCYARPTHQYLDFGAGTDFERKIVAKVNAPEKLREEFLKKSWQGETLVFSGVTDCYQPMEASLELTRKCLQVCAEFRNPVSIISKGALMRRDIDILSELNETASVSVYFSIAFSDDLMSKEIEPGAPRPSIRFRAMQALSEAGIPCGVGIAPVIPGLNDFQIPEILRLAKESGATRSFMTLLRLPKEVKDVFLSRLSQKFPEHYSKVVNQLKEMKNGRLNRSEFGSRMTGEGVRWEAIEFMFRNACEKYDFNSQRFLKRPASFCRPQKQLKLF